MARAKSAQQFDVEVLIVGGGMVGGTLACILADQGIATAVVEREAPSDVLVAEYDGRASAIALGTQRVLEGAGLWNELEPLCAPIRDIRVADGESMLFLHYDHRDLGDQAFGYMVENRYHRVALANRYAALENLHVIAPDGISELIRTTAGVEARLDSGKVIRARLAVGADGRRSQTRERAGIRLTQWSYEQTGIVCTVAHEKSHENIAYEHFLPAGPFAILPLTDNRSSIVWTERAGLAPAIMALDDVQFCAELKRRFGGFLGEMKPVGPRWSYPLSLQFAEQAIAQRLALVGDASHGMHPIAGQGLNMGLRDVAALAEVLIDARRLGLDLGASTVLERYQKWRRFDNTVMLAMTDVLNRLFSNDIAPIRIARDLGLAAVNAVPPLKRMFMRHAMGLVGDLPRLMRGQPL